MERKEMLWRLLSGFGALLFAAGLLSGRIFAKAEIPSLAMTLLGVAGLLSGLMVRQQTGEKVFDERFLLHRLKSSRFSLAVTVAALVGSQVYAAIVLDEIRWDLVAVIALMAVSKIAAMIYYNLKG